MAVRDAGLLVAYYKEFVEGVPDATLLVSATGQIVLANRLAEAMFGYEQGELEGKAIDGLIPHRFRGAHGEHCAAYVAKPRTRAMGVGLDLRGLRKDGAEFPVDISLSAAESSQATFVLAVIRNLLQDAQRVRAVFDQLDVGVAYSSLDGKVLDANQKACELCGYTLEEIRRLSVPDLMLPNDVRKFVEARGEMLAKKRTGFSRDLELARKGGERVWAHVTMSLIRNSDGRAIHFLSMLHDISAQKRAEAQRRESELRFRQVAENIRDVFWLADAEKREILYVSPAYEAIWGRRPDELYVSPRSWFEPIHPEDRDRVAKAALSDQALGKYNEEYRIVRPDGSLRWIHDRAFPVQDPSGKVVRIAGVAEDVTERKRILEDLRNSEHRFRAVLEQSLTGIYVIQDGAIVYVNPRLRAIFGYATSEPFDSDPLAHIKESERARVAEEIRLRFEGKPSATYSVTARRKDGVEFVLEVSATRATFQGAPAIVAMAQDISEKARAEDAIKRYIARLEHAMHSTIKVITSIGEARDPYTRGHERRVGDLAAAIASEMGLDGNFVDGIRTIGYLHDVGKIGLPAEILSKPTRLTEAEYNLVKTHAQRSYEILKDVEFPWPVAVAAWQHHERLDGSGYPRGLRGEQITREARILAVADTVEAMASHRPYRPGLGLGPALEEIENGRGRIYCPDAVDACLRLFRVKGFELPA